jgi:hypothetical protein
LRSLTLLNGAAALVDSSSAANVLTISGNITGSSRGMLIVSTGDKLTLAASSGSHSNLRLYAVAEGALDIVGSATMGSGSWVLVNGKLLTGRTDSDLTISDGAIVRLTEACRLLSLGTMNFRSLNVDGGIMSVQSDITDVLTATTRWSINVATLTTSSTDNAYFEVLGQADMNIGTIESNGRFSLDAAVLSSRTWNITNPSSAQYFSVRAGDTVRFIWTQQSTRQSVLLRNDIGGGATWPCTFDNGAFDGFQSCQLTAMGDYYYSIQGDPVVGRITVTDKYDYAYTGGTTSSYLVSNTQLTNGGTMFAGRFNTFTATLTSSGTFNMESYGTQHINTLRVTGGTFATYNPVVFEGLTSGSSMLAINVNGNGNLRFDLVEYNNAVYTGSSRVRVVDITVGGPSAGYWYAKQVSVLRVDTSFTVSSRGRFEMNPDAAGRLYSIPRLTVYGGSAYFYRAVSFSHPVAITVGGDGTRNGILDLDSIIVGSVIGNLPSVDPNPYALPASVSNIGGGSGSITINNNGQMRAARLAIQLDSVSIQQGGTLEFYSEGNARADSFYINGNMYIYNPCTLRGKDGGIMDSFTIGPSGLLIIDRVNNAEQSTSTEIFNWNITDVNTIASDIHTIDGILHAGLLDTTDGGVQPLGWVNLRVGGTFTFFPHSSIRIKSTTIYGNGKIESLVSLTQNTPWIGQDLTITGTGTLDLNQKSIVLAGPGLGAVPSYMYIGSLLLASTGARFYASSLRILAGMVYNRGTIDVSQGGSICNFGRGAPTSISSSNGASFGGRGGAKGGFATVGSVYGNVLYDGSIYDVPSDVSPDLFYGSGGACGNLNPSSAGARGGGFIQMHTRTMVNLGSIRSNGQDGLVEQVGGGSGGSISILTSHLRGSTGRYSVTGGDAYNASSGGGSGGRVFIREGGSDQWVPMFTTASSSQASVPSLFDNSDLTVWEPTDTTSASLIMDFGEPVTLVKMVMRVAAINAVPFTLQSSSYFDRGYEVVDALDIIPSGLVLYNETFEWSEIKNASQTRRFWKLTFQDFTGSPVQVSEIVLNACTGLVSSSGGSLVCGNRTPKLIGNAAMSSFTSNSWTSFLSTMGENRAADPSSQTTTSSGCK